MPILSLIPAVVVYFRNGPCMLPENVWPSSATLKEGHNSACRCSPSYLRHAEITKEEEGEQPSSKVRNSSPFRSNAVGSSLQHAAVTMLLSSQVDDGDKGSGWKDYFSPSDCFFYGCLLMPHSKNIQSFSIRCYYQYLRYFIYPCVIL